MKSDEKLLKERLEKRKKKEPKKRKERKKDENKESSGRQGNDGSQTSEMGLSNLIESFQDEMVSTDGSESTMIKKPSKTILEDEYSSILNNFYGSKMLNHESRKPQRMDREEITESNKNIVSHIYREKRDMHGKSHFVKSTRPHNNSPHTLNAKTEKCSKYGANKNLEAEKEVDFHHISRTPIGFAIQCQKIFDSIALLCHGFMAGLSFCHMMMMYIVMKQTSSDVLQFFKMYYSSIGQSYHLLFNVLSALCLMSVMDRIDMASGNLKRIVLHHKLGIIALLLYSTVYVATIVATYHEHEITYLTYSDGDDEEKHRLDRSFARKASMENGTKINKESSSFKNNTLDWSRIIEEWQTMNYVRGVGSIIGWIILAFNFNENLLNRSLEGKANTERRSISSQSLSTESY